MRPRAARVIPHDGCVCPGTATAAVPRPWVSGVSGSVPVDAAQSTVGTTKSLDMPAASARSPATRTRRAR